MSTASEISVVRVALPADRAADEANASTRSAVWTPVSRGATQRPSPPILVGLAVLAGVAAMALGALAMLALVRSQESPASQAATPVPLEGPGATAERRALALLAKPSTERVVFRGSAGRLVLVVGSGGRAALLIRGFEPAAAGLPYRAWVVGPQRIVPAAAFTGGERAVVLSAPVGRGASVVVATSRSAALRPGTARLVATRS